MYDLSFDFNVMLHFLHEKLSQKWGGLLLLFIGGILFLVITIRVFNAVKTKGKKSVYWTNFVIAVVLLLLLMVFGIMRFITLSEVDDNMINEKPVIYLYGYNDALEVELELSEGACLTHTYPKYNNGWHVNASPGGKLSDGNLQYDYLFWEGEFPSDFEWNMSSGFCFKGEDTISFLEVILKKLGLNDREMNDFITYWLPRMEDNPYNVAFFQGKSYTDAVKINVSDKPDAMIRVYMVWYGTDEPVDDLPVQKIKDNSDYKRNGKVVVEWGGTELKKDMTNSMFDKNEVDFAEVFDGVGSVMFGNDGNHEFVDYTGETYMFTDAEWSKLVETWAWTGNPEMMIQKQTVKTLLDTLSVLQ